MVRVESLNDQVTFNMLGWHVLWACCRRITVPRQAIVDVQSARAADVLRPVGWRGPGTHLPGRLIAGTYRQRGSKTFWDVGDPDRALVFTLSGGPFSMIVVEVEDPSAVLRGFSR